MPLLVIDFLAEAGRLLLLALCWAGLGAGALAAAISAAELWMHRRGFASWREIARGDGYFALKGDPGLLRRFGCVLGAARRHTLSRWRILRTPWGRTLFLGQPELVSAALRATVKDWDGALVYIDAVGGSAGLGRVEAVELAPSARGGVSYNPMLAIRRGVHAFGDAQVLASALLQSTDARLVQPFAALILDQLFIAAMVDRNLPALRRRLFDARNLFQEMAAHVHVQATDNAAWEADPEIRRIAKACATDVRTGQAAIEAMRKALAPFGDGRLQEASIGHQMELSDLMASEGPQTLIVKVPAADPHMTSYCAAILAQLVATCTDSKSADYRGRLKKRPILLVLDDAGALGSVSLLQRRLKDAAQSGLYLCVGARNLEDVARLFDLKEENRSDAAAHFEGLSAVGPQQPESAAALAHMAGGFVWFDWFWPRTWRDLVWPKFRTAYRAFVDATDLERAEAHKALVFAGARQPVRAKAVLQPFGVESRMRDPCELPGVAHDWDAAPPPVEEQNAGQTEAAVRRATPAEATSHEANGSSRQGELTLITQGEAPVRVTSSNQLRQALASRPVRSKTF